jgi:hypothetical protein
MIRRINNPKLLRHEKLFPGLLLALLSVRPHQIVRNQRGTMIKRGGLDIVLILEAQLRANLGPINGQTLVVVACL